jgi:6-pyruvoyltetrahydropterin/6-carboxytetrahydropterin synthase
LKIGKTFTFEAAHRLQNHDGTCKNLHGHSYRVDVSVEGPELQTEGPQKGMLLDFGQLNIWWDRAGAPLDHVTILEDSDPLVAAMQALDGVKLVTFLWPPTAENLAKYLQDDLQGWLMHHTSGSMIASVRVWETAKSWAEA